MSVNRGYMPTAKSVEWGTPQDLFDQLHAEFDFTLDVAASHLNHKCDRYFTEETDGLKQDWAGERCFLNPPYGTVIKKWAAKAYAETNNPFTRAEVVVGLLPVRSDTGWFHDHIYKKPRVEIRLLRGRLKFTNSESGTSSSATFPSMVVIWRSE